MAGGTASGKTTVCNHIIQRLHDQCVVVINQDSFYKELGPREKAKVAKNGTSPLQSLYLSSKTRAQQHVA